MSENIQSIANGSFVLGNTSATTYQAGPGISITQPSEGTVRISNDETVLWSGDFHSTGTTITLSEPMTAFEKLEFWNKPGQVYSIGSNWSASQPTAYMCECDYNRVEMNASGFKYITVTLSANSSDFKTIEYKRNQVCLFVRGSTTGQCGMDYYRNVLDAEARISKIVGINRISGGNA